MITVQPETILKGNMIHEAGACSLSEALKTNTTLTTLNLSGTQEQQDKAEDGHDISHKYKKLQQKIASCMERVEWAKH